MGKTREAIGVVWALPLVTGLFIGGTVAAQQASAGPGEALSEVEETTPMSESESESESDMTPPISESKAWDALAVRPVSFVSSLFSTGVFVVAIPFAAIDPALDIEQARENLVDHPFKDTFQRPLGDFSGSAWGAAEDTTEPAVGHAEK